jgi:hypothetical protein
MVSILFAAISIYSLSRSAKKRLTLTYMGLWMVVSFVGYLVLGYVFHLPGMAAGEFGLYCGLLCGMLAALIHSRRNPKIRSVE